ncbi:MAG: RdgB/HAM1 family non-canonical purine NTP pyrophosphatase [Acidobacteria bacterium]|nr:RdgB/HAM1 family non-canonical purine NTP pyrophosphatase [Acidobacteriota bacterium]
MMTVVIATGNRHKLREIGHLLGGLSCTIDPIHAHAAAPAPDETGTTFAENARLKALYYSRFVPHLTIAEDSGLEIDALDGAPGIHSARFNGDTYAEKFEALYARLRERNATASPARFVCALAAVDDGRVVFEATGRIEGRIAETPAGAGGFGYDPIFLYPPFGCTLAEVSADRKASISHRGAAFRQVRAFLESRLKSRA